jgi:hypothetical protein
LYLFSEFFSIPQELNAETGIDLENIVYYKGDTHYFVMTAKKESLLKKGVLKAVSSWCIQPSTVTYLTSILELGIADQDMPVCNWFA